MLDIHEDESAQKIHNTKIEGNQAEMCSLLQELDSNFVCELLDHYSKGTHPLLGNGREATIQYAVLLNYPYKGTQMSF